MASIKVENEMASAAATAPEVELDLATVKRLTQQVTSFGLDNAEKLIFQWRLENASQPTTSYLFLINNCDLLGQLRLTRTLIRIQLYLNLIDLETGEPTNYKLNPFQFFLCKFTLHYKNESKYFEKRYVSMNAFNQNSDKNTLDFNVSTLEDVKALTIELYQEPLAMIEYRSPYDNVVVGKIEKFENSRASGEFLSASPRFNVGSTHQQLMIVTFCRPNLQYWFFSTGLSAILHILSEGESRGTPFPLAVTFTVFSQKANAKDLVYNLFFPRDVNKSEYSIFLAFPHELNQYLENDTLFYKVVIEPHRPGKKHDIV